MPDRTKMPRPADRNLPKFVEGGQGMGDVLRTDLPQTVEIDGEWGIGLQAVAIDSPDNLQFAGPGSITKYYRPHGKEQIVGRAGLDDGDTVRGLEGHAMKTIAPSLVGTGMAPRAHGRNKK